MNSEDVASIVKRELDNYRYDPPTGMIGVPWSAERVQQQIGQLRAALIRPELRPILRLPPEVPVKAIQELWVVAIADGGFVVFYDPAIDEFGLALQGPAGPAESIAVMGDLVGTYCAR